MKKDTHFSIGLWSTDDVQKIAKENDINFLTEEEKNTILRKGISRNLIHIRKYISVCIEAEIHRELKKDFSDFKQKQIERYGQE